MLPELATAKPEGDVVKLTFKGDSVDACLEWKTTSRVQSIGPSGDVNYEKTCKKRGKVANQETATEVSTKFAAGLAPVDFTSTAPPDTAYRITSGGERCSTGLMRSRFPK